MKSKIVGILLGVISIFVFSDSVKASDVSANISCQTHIQNIGWQDAAYNGATSGTEGQSLRLEAIVVNLMDSNVSGEVYYQVHVQNIGWVDPSKNGEVAGTTGQSLRLEAIKIELSGDITNYYDVYYQTHVQNIGWLDWAKNGEESGSAGYGYRLEAIRIVLVKKGDPAPGATTNRYYETEPNVYYQTHIEGIGWQNNVTNGEMSGTSGESRRLEAMIIGLSNNTKGGSISYQTHIQNIGWQDAVSANQLGGTTGQSLRMEAIKIELTGNIANYYDIYYQVHVQNVGWLDWAKNGERAGSEGYGYRLEAIRIVLVKKGNSAPGTTATPFINNSSFVWINNSLYNTESQIILKNVSKIIDVSAHQGIIDWDTVKNSGDIDGVILRVGYGSYTEDSKFSRNIAELKRLGIPYGIYLYSYAENSPEALSEANFVLSEISKYSLNPTLGIYYDIEGWYLNPSTTYPNGYDPNISIETYDQIITTFINRLSSVGYNSNVYTYLNYIPRFSLTTRSYVSWIAQYNSSCSYTGSYKMWQYTSSGYIPGISTNVDISAYFN